MIEVKNLKKRYHNNIVLDGIDLKINKGDVVGIIGPSGTGKSTLLRCINQLEVPESGEITINDLTVDLSKKKQKDILKIRNNTGMVFQKFNLFERKTVLENVMEGLIIVQKKSKNEAIEIARSELKRVGMSAWENHYPKHLSGGQQQRVAIARALAMKPQLLLLDEPTSALDPELVGEVLGTIRTVAENGFTMLLVSHEMNFVRNVSNRVIFLDGGHIVDDGTPQEVFQNPKHQRTKDFFNKMHLMNQPEYII